MFKNKALLLLTLSAFAPVKAIHDNQDQIDGDFDLSQTAEQEQVGFLKRHTKAVIRSISAVALVMVGLAVLNWKYKKSKSAAAQSATSAETTTEAQVDATATVDTAAPATSAEAAEVATEVTHQ